MPLGSGRFPGFSEPFPNQLEERLASIGAVVGMDPEGFLVDSIDGADPVRSWLATLLNALDGRPIGSIHLFDRGPDAYSDDDEAVLVQLAQLGSAAIERVDVYARRSTSALSGSGAAPGAGG
jgi:GAF domain-containing protein